MIITSKRYKTLNKQFKELYKISFPKDERLPYSFLLKILKANKGELIHYYDEGNFVGFISSTHSNQFICLAFFATNPNFRNQGYGKEILNNYTKANADKIVFLNCEIPENKNDDNIKYRRLNFYKRNGFIITPIVMTYKNVNYLTLVSKEINDKEINELNDLLISFKCICKTDESVLKF